MFLVKNIQIFIGDFVRHRVRDLFTKLALCYWTCHYENLSNLNTLLACHQVKILLQELNELKNERDRFKFGVTERVSAAFVVEKWIHTTGKIEHAFSFAFW